MNTNDIFIERSTNVEKDMEDFKKRHKYDPESGTIDVNGHRVKFKTHNNGKTAYYYKASNRNSHGKKDESYVAMGRKAFRHGKDYAEYIGTHEVVHGNDHAIKRRINNDRESLVYKINSGTDLSKYPKEIRKKRIELKQAERLNLKESNKAKQLVNKAMQDKKKKELEKDISDFISKSNDERAKEKIAYDKLRKAADAQAKKNLLLLSKHDMKPSEILADAGALRIMNKDNEIESINKNNLTGLNKSTDEYFKRRGEREKEKIRNRTRINKKRMLNHNNGKMTFGDHVKDKFIDSMELIGTTAKDVEMAARSAKKKISNSTRIRNANKIARMPEARVLETVMLNSIDKMNTYNIIYEELQDKVYSGEITLEFAEMVNDLAYDKYISESLIDRIKTRFTKVKIVQPPEKWSYASTGLKFRGIDVSMSAYDTKTKNDRVPTDANTKALLKNVVIAVDRVFDREFDSVCDYCMEECDWDESENGPKNKKELLQIMKMDNVTVHFIRNKSNYVQVEVWFNSRAQNINNAFFGGHSLIMDFTYNNGKLEYNGHTLAG